MFTAFSPFPSLSLSLSLSLSQVDIGRGQFVHLRIYEKLPCYGGAVELSAMQTDKMREDALEYFERSQN